MNLARDDAGNIRELQTTKASGLANNVRDASGGTGGKQHTWRQGPMPILLPAKGSRAQAPNPFSGRMTSYYVREGWDGKAGSSKALKSSSSQPPQKRRKLGDHLPENIVSKFFDKDAAQRRRSQAAPSAPSSTSFHTTGTKTDPIIIDIEDDAPATNDKRPESIMLRTSSPDPIDIFGPDSLYAFGQKKPSPMHQFSLSFEGMHKPPKNGDSTARLRNTMKLAETHASGSGSRLDGDGDDLQPPRVSPIRLRTAQTAQAEASFGRSNVKEKVAYFERDRTVPHLNLRVMGQSRKNAMKPKRPKVPPLLLLRQLDFDATKSSSLVSVFKPSKGKAAASRVSIHLPLKEWSIGAIIPPQDIAPEPQFNLIWELGVLKVRHVNGPTLFELQVKSGSVDNIKYVDIKKTRILEPLIQIHSSPMASVQNHTRRIFKPGSSDIDGLLTFKFDRSASGWDNDVYVGLVQKLVDALV